LALTSVDIAQLVKKVLQDNEALVRDKGIHLSLDLDENLPALQADPQALHQVFSCLLHNAASATVLNGEVGLSIQREAQTPKDGEQTDCIFISVRDSGAGIASEDLPKVFGGQPTAEPIIGLGEAGYELAGLRPLVEAHRGRIWVMSELGKGSTFNMLLPVAGSPAKPASVEPQAGPPADPPLPEPKPLDFVALPPDGTEPGR
jgi:signal transduction histidine kinase